MVNGPFDDVIKGSLDERFESQLLNKVDSTSGFAIKNNLFAKIIFSKNLFTGIF